MEDFNLEEDYGLFLDLLDESLYQFNNPVVQHFGVKGMKWGVRKERTAAEEKARNPITGFGPDKVTRKTRSGETLTMTKDKVGPIGQFLGRHSKAYRDLANKEAHLTITDSKGKKVGEASIDRRSKDELYLNWLGIDRHERGKGYATAVMQAGVEFGRQSGAKRLTLEVPGHSPDAAHIYEKLGFKFVAGQKPYHNDPKEGVWGGLYDMELRFDDAKHTGLPGISDEAILRHYGVRGMKWGVRRERNPQPVVTVTTPGRKVKAKGGANQPPSEDAIAAATAHRTAKKSTTDALSTKELQALVNRMNLEKQFAELEKQGVRDTAGKKFVKKMLNEPKNREQALGGINKAISIGAFIAPHATGAGKVAAVGLQAGGAVARAYVHKNGAGSGKKK
jgi:ribosomal protein S18 acetylase RimI-like enzyme